MNPDAWWTGLVATFDDTVVFELETMEGSAQYQASYEIADGVVTLGAAEEVAVTEVVTPKGVTQPAATDPEKAPASAGVPPADVPVGQVRLAAMRAQAALSLTT
jgi:hypothetical protein